MLEPLPETVEALAEYVSLEEPHLDESLAQLSERARAVVPDLVGLSLVMVDGDATFTLVAPNSAVAMLDATQYLAGGPCLEVVEDSLRGIEADVQDLLDEERWSLLARTSAAIGVASTLSLSFFDSAGHLRGCLNLYASKAGAFVGVHDALADALGASATGAVADADLAFTSRQRARAMPARLRADREIETVVGFLAASHFETVEEARERLQDSAARAGVPLALAARVLLLVHAR